MAWLKTGSLWIEYTVSFKASIPSSLKWRIWIRTVAFKLFVLAMEPFLLTIYVELQDAK
jgi:hypothetical protein